MTSAYEALDEALRDAIDHTFTLRGDGLWWCDQDDIPSDFCFDEERCSNGCVCNVGDPDVRDRHVEYHLALYRLELEAGRVQESAVLAIALRFAKRELEEAEDE